MAIWLAWRALSAFWRTVEPSSSIDAAVSSSALAWLSVREDRSWLPCAISALAVETCSEPWRTRSTTLARLSRMAWIPCIKLSLDLDAGMSTERSPWAIWWVM